MFHNILRIAALSVIFFIGYQAMNQKDNPSTEPSASVEVVGTKPAAEVAAPVKPAQKRVLNIYSSRKEELMQELYRNFGEERDVIVNVQTDKAEKLLYRMQAEQQLTPADVYLTADIGNLAKASERALLRATISPSLSSRIPANYRDPDFRWYGFSKRVRAIFYAKDRVNPEDIKRYEDLADPKWKGKLLIRSSSNVYNQSLISSIIEANGVEETRAWLDGVVANFARAPQGGDTDQLRALAAGEGDIAVANSYYYARLLASENPEDKEIASKIGIIFPNQGEEDRGAHVNISGGAIIAFSENTDLAVEFLNFLATDEAQKVYAHANYEFPVIDSVALPEILKSWGAFKMDEENLTKFPKHISLAIRMADESGWR